MHNQLRYDLTTVIRMYIATTKQRSTNSVTLSGNAPICRPSILKNSAVLPTGNGPICRPVIFVIIVLLKFLFVVVVIVV